MINFSLYEADEANASVNGAAETIDKTKKNLNDLSNDATTLADQAKSTAGTFFDHAKGKEFKTFPFFLFLFQHLFDLQNLCFSI